MMKDCFPPIGFIRTCFTEKFGVPRQSLMVRDAYGILKLNPDPAFRAALNHLEKFSHVWIVFVFHRHLDKKWRSTIRPPRVSGPRRVGAFASRSPHRPNPIGLSAVKLEKIDLDAAGGIEIHLSGVDFLDETPVLYIKPYLPFADCISEANSGWAGDKIPQYPVTFSEKSLEAIHSATQAGNTQLGEPRRFKLLITQMLEWDPRPTSQRRAMPIESPHTEGMIFAFRLLNFDVQWQVRNQAIYVLDVLEQDSFPE